MYNENEQDEMEFEENVSPDYIYFKYLHFFGNHKFIIYSF